MKDAPMLQSIVQEDVAGKKSEIARLSELLAEREMELAEWQTALAHFQYRYYLAVGSKYVELDELRAKIAQRRADRLPDDEQFAHEARYRRFRAERSAGEYRRFRTEERSAEVEKVPNSAPAKKLYREIAIEIHPDRAGDETSRRLRTALMAELNAAYASNDTGRMQAILDEWRSSPEAVTGYGTESELKRLARIVSRLERRIRRLEKEISRILESTPGRLLRRTREAAEQGRDLLAELAAEIELKIRRAREDLEEETRRSPCRSWTR